MLYKKNQNMLTLKNPSKAPKFLGINMFKCFKYKLKDA